MFTLTSPVGAISHIGRSVDKQLQHLKILTVQDLLFYFPARYDDLSKITPIREVKVGERAVVRVRIELLESARSKWRRKLITHAMVSDATGSVRVVWFNQPWIAKMFKSGDEVYLVGELKDEGSGAYFSSPAYERVGKKAAVHAARIVPVYPSTEKLSQKQIRFLMQRALPLARAVTDPLPQELRARYRLAPLPPALVSIHFPADEARLEAARRRLKFDELLNLQLFAASLKRELKKIPAPSITFHEEETKQFVESLPFKLTDAQRKAAWEIIRDLGKSRPMNRLLEGDVGSGKTVVVAIAALNAVLGCSIYGDQISEASEIGSPPMRGQVAIMAPTEILARQHFGTFSRLLVSMGVKVGLITHASCFMNHETRGMRHELKRSEMLRNVRNGVVDVIVGTHALIQKDANFKNLVLAVVDEQHRFGVAQRAALKGKRDDGLMPHLLSLTATPIPRSLALVFYGDLDISILDEMPKGRQKIETRILNANERANAYEFVRSEVKNDHQVFWTCPIIDPSDTLGVKAATEVFEHLRGEVFPDLKLGLLHGRMKSKERERVMQEFAGISTPTPPESPPRAGGEQLISPPFQGGVRGGSDHKIDILVATPVIEVGIDVPNATVMVIEGSERFGLAQLHQFRGRVGRGQAKSYCLLFVEGEPNARIQAFLESSDGFALAEKDLALRGPGEVYGTAQSGFPEFKIASFADMDIAKEAKEAAQWLLAQDPELLRYPQLKKMIMGRNGKAHLE